MKLHGIIPAMITLFKGEGEIDENALREHIDYLVDCGIHGLFALGSTGEFAYLSQEEKKQVLALTADQLNGRIPLIAGISSLSTKLSIELAKYSEKIGADAVMAVLPTYFMLENKNIEMHFEKIATAIELPLYAYNFPLTTRIDLTPKLVAKLADKKVLAGIKETVIDLEHIRKMRELTPEDFCLLCGSEIILRGSLDLGVDGAILGMGNGFPKLFVEIWKAYQNKNTEKLEILWRDFQQIIPLINQPMDYLPSMIKEILLVKGRNLNPQVRSPLRPIKEKWRKKLEKLEILKKY
ncbi:MAG: dihydrodipicolinate synthase family protein [Candidatus Helarchaeota archaeon]